MVCTVYFDLREVCEVVEFGSLPTATDNGFEIVFRDNVKDR